jgi:hypothetical protein
MYRDPITMPVRGSVDPGGYIPPGLEPLLWNHPLPRIFRFTTLPYPYVVKIDYENNVTEIDSTRYHLDLTEHQKNRVWVTHHNIVIEAN